jgi:DNA repair ATPase RecN
VLILDVASALARRSAAESALSEAIEALTAALDELQRHGFELNQIAETLQIDASEITGISSSRRSTVRSPRPDNPLDSSPN